MESVCVLRILYSQPPDNRFAPAPPRRRVARCAALATTGSGSLSPATAFLHSFLFFCFLFGRPPLRNMSFFIYDMSYIIIKKKGES